LYEEKTIYRPLQLYPSDCPGLIDGCMSYVYNYSAKEFRSRGPASITPKDANREAFVYMTQDENNNFDVVMCTATSYKDTKINATVDVDGSSPANVLVYDDPPSGNEDKWNWNNSTNHGDIQWQLQPGYTDGGVFGHFSIEEENFCFTTTYRTNWLNAITRFVALNGTVALPGRAAVKQIPSGSVTSFQFCTYPGVIISHTDSGCGSVGSVSAVSLNKTSSATFVWKNSNGNVIGTTSTVNNVSPGVYTVTITVDDCDTVRSVEVKTSGVNIQVSSASTAATPTKNGKVVLTISGGYPPYGITWKNDAGNVIATNTTTLNAPAGTYTYRVYDGCNDVTDSVTIDGPGACPAGSYLVGDDCMGCPPGTYSTAANSPSCTVCPPGSYNVVANSTSCNTCPSNSVSSGGDEPCTMCGDNMVSGSASATCTPCPLGQQRIGAAATCSSCGAGNFRCAPDQPCASCPAGTKSSSDKSYCEMCSAGTSQSATGQSSCSPCSANSYAASGASSCTSCPGGTSAPAGSTVMLACM